MASSAQQVYVLRLWRDGPAPGDLRVSVYDPGRDERRHFRDLGAALEHLRRQSGGVLAPPPPRQP